jgi:hypothetical protein
MPHHELAPTQTVFHDPRRIEWVKSFRHMLQNKHLSAIANTRYGIAIAEFTRAKTDIAAVFRPAFQETLLPFVPAPLPRSHVQMWPHGGHVTFREQLQPDTRTPRILTRPCRKVSPLLNALRWPRNPTPVSAVHGPLGPWVCGWPDELTTNASPQISRPTHHRIRVHLQK